MNTDSHATLHQIFLLALGTAEIFEAEHSALFRLAPPHQRSAINLLAEGVYAVRDGLEAIIYSDLDEFHEKSLQNPSLQTRVTPL